MGQCRDFATSCNGGLREQPRIRYKNPEKVVTGVTSHWYRADKRNETRTGRSLKRNKEVLTSIDPVSLTSPFYEFISHLRMTRRPCTRWVLQVPRELSRPAYWFVTMIQCHIIRSRSSPFTDPPHPDNARPNRLSCHPARPCSVQSTESMSLSSWAMQIAFPPIEETGDLLVQQHIEVQLYAKKTCATKGKPVGDGLGHIKLTF